MLLLYLHAARSLMSVPEQRTNQKTLEAGLALQTFVLLDGIKAEAAFCPAL